MKKLKPCIIKSVIVKIMLIFFALHFSGCYVLKQGVYLLRYQRKAEKVSKLLEDSTLSDSVRNFLLLTREIKQFSSDTLGLVRDENFSSYLTLTDDNVVYVVSACKSDSFEKYEWKFPFFGSFPYKGFFIKKDAVSMAKKLEDKGYDVYVRGAGAFSTLGIFTDPLYSYMKNYSLFDLASIMIHEQTHATIFLKDNVQFNEELATFIGDEGALLFIYNKYGKDTELYKNSKLAQKDFETFIQNLKILYKKLENLYDSHLSKEEKLVQKSSIIQDHKNQFEQNYDSLFHTDNFHAFTKKTINNAYLISFMTYTKSLDIFYELYIHHSFSLPKTIGQLKKIKKKEKKPKEFIRDTLLQ